METSLLDSPRRRISIKQKNLVDVEQDDDDNESELKNRRLEAINKSTNLKRRSVAALVSVGMNAAQLAKHCQDCLKLSAENKINSKNAFSLLLIDAMAAMAKKGDSELSQNFQVATTTLDASVKIYGYRVDAIHTDAMKMAGGLLNKELQQALEDDEENVDDGDVGKVKRVKKRRKMYTVVAADTLSAKSESEVLLDVPPKKTMLARNTEGKQLLTCVPKYNDGCLFMITADVPCWPADGNWKPPSIPDDFDMETLMKNFSEIPVTTGNELCEIVTKITFDCEEDEESELSQSVFEFDANASVPDCDEPEAPVPRLAIPCSGYDSGDEIALPQRVNRTSVPSTINELTTRLSKENQEYSLFDNKTLKSWAGPMFGNWRLTRVTNNNTENKENNIAMKNKRGRRTKQKDPISTWFKMDEKQISPCLVQTSKSILAKATLLSWKPATVTLTVDYKYEPQQLLQLFYLQFGVETSKPETPQPVVDNDWEENNCEESFGDRMLSSNATLAIEFGETNEREVEEWDQGNMVAVPIKVEKMPVSKFQKPKHVDMQQLKTCIWDIISDGGDEKTEKPVPFFELCTECPVKLPKKVAETISVPVLFNALLHLANEKSLVLTQKEGEDGFMISV